MAQLSRPLQIGLVAVAVLAGAWLLLVRGHNSAGTGAPSVPQIASAPSHTVTASAAPAPKAEGTAGSATGHGSASSLGSLGHAVEKARGAVTNSHNEETKIAERSAQASSESSSTSPSGVAATPAPSAAKPSSTTAVPSVANSAPAKTKTAPSSAVHRDSATARQRTVEAQLAQGKVAVILFWDPKGADDRVVQRALHSLRGNSGLRIAIDEAAPSQVASFGTITRGVQVYGTPTLLFVNGKGQALTRTGFQDAYTIAQAVREARRPVKA